MPVLTSRSAMSRSFTLLFWLTLDSIAKAWSAVTRCRSMRMPWACPIKFRIVTVRPDVVRASVGAACAGPGEAVTNQLVLDADTAMYQAKRRAAVDAIVDLRQPSDEGASPPRR